MTTITEIIPKDMPDWFKQDMADGQVFCRIVKRHDAQEKKIAELKGLILVAKCPNCDGEGAYYDNYGNVCQCQWCYEVELLTKEDKE